MVIDLGPNELSFSAFSTAHAVKRIVTATKCRKAAAT